jgi:hypothetical protein
LPGESGGGCDTFRTSVGFLSLLISPWKPNVGLSLEGIYGVIIESMHTIREISKVVLENARHDRDAPEKQTKDIIDLLVETEEKSAKYDPRAWNISEEIMVDQVVHSCHSPRPCYLSPFLSRRSLVRDMRALHQHWCGCVSGFDLGFTDCRTSRHF